MKTKTIKSLLLTNEFPPHVYGGAGVHVEYLSRELSKLIQVEVRCFGDQARDDPNLRVRGFNVPSELLAPTSKELAPAIGTMHRCVAINAEPVDADVVHCHTWYTHMGGIIAKQLYGIPLVITTHSLEPLRPWKREQLGRGYDFSSWIERTALEMADAVIAVSRGTKHDVLDHFKVSDERIAVIPNGIDTHEYRPDPGTNFLSHYGVPTDIPYVLFVGRITRQKGIMHLVRAIDALDPEVAVVLCAGAPDTDEIAVEMREGVARVQARRKHVYWIQEMVPKPAAIQLYSHAAVFCCPSIYEPFGIINLEAMACETAVVASAVGGITEVVDDGTTGLLVPLAQRGAPTFDPVDPAKFSHDLADAINQLMRAPERRTHMGHAGRQRAVTYFSWAKVAERVRDLYASLIAARGNKEHDR